MIPMFRKPGKRGGTPDAYLCLFPVRKPQPVISFIAPDTLTYYPSTCFKHPGLGIRRQY